MTHGAEYAEMSTRKPLVILSVVALQDYCSYKSPYSGVQRGDVPGIQGRVASKEWKHKNLVAVT